VVPSNVRQLPVPHQRRATKSGAVTQETHYVSATMSNRLMLFGETVAVYCENHTEHTYTLCGQNLLRRAQFHGVS
jgi:hypothetical protein